MSDRPLYGTLLLDGVAFPCVDDVGYQNLAQFARKVVSGNPSRDDDDLISSKIWTVFNGGIGVLNNVDVADDGKNYFSTIWDRDQFGMTLNRKVVKVAASPAVQYPLGDLAGVFYAATASTAHAWNETTDAFGGALTGTFSAAPVGRAVAWNGRLYVPCGAAGYHTVTASAIASVVSGVQAIAYIVLSDPQVSRLFALTYDGKLYSTINAAETGTTWNLEATLNASETPRKLAIWMDRTEQDTLFVSTNQSVYAYDPTNGVIVRTRISDMPPHPDNGLGMAPWRPGEDLYVSFGLRVMRYAAGMSQIDEIGPNRRDGLPPELRGRVVDLLSEFGALTALVEGVSVAGAAPGSEFDPGHEDEPTEVRTLAASSAVLQFDGFGWHPIWTSGSATGTATWLCVSGASSAYRLWWGWGGGLYTINLPRTGSTPVQEFRTGEGAFEQTGTIDIGWFDGNMREFQKLASHVEVNLESGTATETVGVEYDTDWDNNWRALGTAAAFGKTVLPFVVQTMDDGTSFSEGLAFRRFRWRATLNRTVSDTTKTPILDSVVLKYLRLPLSGQSFSITVPLQAVGPEGWEQRTAGQIKEDLEELLVKPGFIRVQPGGDLSCRARISYVNGVDRTGEDDRGFRTVSLVCVPLDGFEGMM